MKSAIAVMLVALAAAGAGCESDADKQHHLFNLQKCIADTNAVDDILKKDADPIVRGAAEQHGHDYRAAQCMSIEEKTTLEYQRAKNDDYGKVPPPEPPEPHWK